MSPEFVRYQSVTNSDFVCCENEMNRALGHLCAHIG